MNKIHLIYDRKFGCVYGATTDYAKAVAKMAHLNEPEHTKRYVINTLTDFVDRKDG